MKRKIMEIDRRKELVKEGGRQMLEIAVLVSVTKSSLSHVSDKLFPFLDKSAYRWQLKSVQLHFLI